MLLNLCHSTSRINHGTLTPLERVCQVTFIVSVVKHGTVSVQMCVRYDMIEQLNIGDGKAECVQLNVAHVTKNKIAKKKKLKHTPVPT